MKKEKIDTSWLKDIHNSLERLQTISFRLDHTASAFYETGNKGMSRDLSHSSETIDECIRTIHGALGTMLSNDVNKGQKQIATIFKTLVKGMEEKEKNDKMETSCKT